MGLTLSSRHATISWRAVGACPTAITAPSQTARATAEGGKGARTSVLAETSGFHIFRRRHHLDSNPFEPPRGKPGHVTIRCPIRAGPGPEP